MCSWVFMMITFASLTVFGLANPINTLPSNYIALSTIKYFSSLEVIAEKLIATSTLKIGNEPKVVIVQSNPAPEQTEPQVLVSKVVVRARQGQLSEQLKNEVYRAIRNQSGRTTTRSYLQKDINAIFATGFFSNVQAVPEDTSLGVRVSFVVQPNPILRKVKVQANPGTKVPSILPVSIVDEIFHEQYGSILNLCSLQEGIKRLNKWYQDQGYVLANVIGAPQVTKDGIVTLKMAEGVVEEIQVHLFNKVMNTEVIKSCTPKLLIVDELGLKSGDIFNRQKIQKGLQRLYSGFGFKDVNVSLNPGNNPEKVIIVVNATEKEINCINRLKLLLSLLALVVISLIITYWQKVNLDDA